jgi:phage baseplate assembly protein W
MIGMSTTTGRAIDESTHIRQSIRDILRTPLGSRVMRREYGSALFALIDAPMDRATILDIIQATAGALGRWEPRVRVKRVGVEGVAPGHVRIDLDLLMRSTGQPITIADALADDPTTAARTADDDELIRVDAEGRVRRAIGLPLESSP